MKIFHVKTLDNKDEDTSPKIYGIMKILHLRTLDKKDEDKFQNI